MPTQKSRRSGGRPARAATGTNAEDSAARFAITNEYGPPPSATPINQNQEEIADHVSILPAAGQAACESGDWDEHTRKH
jgi:hypothetical protein